MDVQKHIAGLKKLKRQLEAVTYTVTEIKGGYRVKRGKYIVADSYSKEFAELIRERHDVLNNNILHDVQNMIDQLEIRCVQLTMDLFDKKEGVV